MSRLPLAAAILVILLWGAASASADSPTDNPATRAQSAAPPPAAGAKDANPANDMKPSGAQVLPLPPPDASTVRGQERGNAALRAGQNPSQGGSTDEDGSSTHEK